MLLSLLLFLAFPDLATAAMAAAGRETSIIVLFLVNPTGRPFGLFGKKAKSLPPSLPCSRTALILNWLIEDMVAGVFLRCLVYWAVESMVQSQLQRNIFIMMKRCIVGLS